MHLRLPAKGGKIMTDLVLRQDRESIATLSLNRPDALNALSPTLFVRLRTHIDAIAQQADKIGCVILRGAGRSFSAGNDLKAIQAGEKAPSPSFQAETLEAIERLPQPVICSVQGLELALACDLLICAESAKFADTHGKWGMTPLWGMSQRLPRRVGPLKAKEIMFTGRIVGGREAEAIGLANQCVPDAALESETWKLAQAIAANSWHSLRGIKMLVNRGQDYTLADGLKFERDKSPGRSPDLEERLKKFGGKG
jgi:enoyl-CoA hydratase/carnithine racemase